MSTSTWEIPTASTPPNVRPALVMRVQDELRTVTAAKFAPVVLSRAEASILVGLRVDKLSGQGDGKVFDRVYLNEMRNERRDSSSVPTLHLEEQLVGHSASSSLSSQGTLSTGGNGRKYSHLDYVNPDELNMGRDNRTTFMIRRLPRYISADQLVSLLNRSGFLRDSVDLVYVPIFTGKAHANRGYAFLNFKSPQLGALFMTVVRHSPETELSKQLGRCDIVYAHIQSKNAMLVNLTRVPEGMFWNDPTVPPGLLVLE